MTLMHRGTHDSHTNKYESFSPNPSIDGLYFVYTSVFFVLYYVNVMVMIFVFFIIYREKTPTSKRNNALASEV